MSRTRTQGNVALIAVLLVVTAGCSVPGPERAPATEMQTPDLVWTDGISPSSPLEADERVKVLRAAGVGSAMAWNSGDFTIAQLTDHLTQARIESLVSLYRTDGKHRSYDPGPAPFEPLEIVEEFEDGGGVVEVCRPSLGRSWVYDVTDEFDPVHGSFDPASGRTERLRVVREDEVLKLDGEVPGYSSRECGDRRVPVGLFDPQPVIPAESRKEPVRPPLFEEQ